MNWSKAKTILIIALLFANAILGYFVFRDVEAMGESSDQYLDDKVQELLMRKEIELGSLIPEKPDTIYNLTVEFEKTDPYDINARFFEGRGIREYRKEEGIEEIYRGSETVILINGKELIYTNTENLDINNQKLDVAEAESIARNFLEDRGYSTQDMVLSHSENKNTIYILEFSKIFDENYVEMGHTKVTIEGKIVREIERLWLNTAEIQQADLSVPSASKALLGLLSIDSAYGKKISRIDFCYYFDPEKQNVGDLFLQAAQGTALPAWRVQFDDGTKVILDSE